MPEVVTVNEAGTETRGDAFVPTAPENKPTIFGREPLIYIAIVQASIMALVLFGFDLTNDQSAGIIALATAILTFIARSQVTPVAAPRLPVVSATPGEK